MRQFWKYIFLSVSSLVFLSQLSACTHNQEAQAETNTSTATTPANLDSEGVATFAGGCFWCTEAVFERVKGVKDVFSGYTGGSQKNPTYKQVSYGKTDHAEAVQIQFDPEVVSYEKLLEIFFATHDPTQLNRQGPDVGKQYRSAVFYHNEAQKEAVETYIKKLSESGKYDKKIVTEVSAFRAFYEAEDYHQNYYELHPNQPYIVQNARPKVAKLKKYFEEQMKEKYKNM